MSQIVSGIAVARSADLKLQAWAADPLSTQPWTRWKGSPTQNAVWTPWERFPVPLPTTGVQYMFASQLPGLTGEHRPDVGRMQLWAIVNDEGASTPASQIYTIVKSSEKVNAPWKTWENFASALPLNPPPPQNTQVVTEGSVVPLSDGRLQVWLMGSTGLLSPSSQLYFEGTLWSRVQTSQAGISYTGTQDWSQWKAFPNLPAGSFYSDPTACHLPDGRTQLWVIGESLPVNPPVPLTYTVWTCIRESAPGNLTDPLSGWGPWTAFEQLVPANANGPVRSIRATNDGNGRAYLWFSRFVDVPPSFPQSVYLYYTYTGTPPSVSWHAPVLFSFPLERAATPSFDYDNSLITLGVLPDGNLELIVVSTEVQLSFPIYTAWQQPCQPPTSWFSGPISGWTDFSIP